MAAHAQHAYRRCRAIAKAHYENFPVASRLLPRGLRDPVAAIYVFARRADDHADEGERSATDRLDSLDTMACQLESTASGDPPRDALWQALADVMARFELPTNYLYDLLSAFRQDVEQHRYATFSTLRDYCRRSADPVGRLMLHLAGADNAENRADSDRICTALQLINFLQDLHQDFVTRDRLYLPQDALARHGVTESALKRGRTDTGMESLLAERIEHAAAWLHAGRHLPSRLPGRFGLEIRLIVRGGWRTIERLRADKRGAPFARARLTGADRRWIARGLFHRDALTGVQPPQLGMVPDGEGPEDG